MSIFNRKNAASKRSRTPMGVPSAGEFATEIRSEAAGVVLTAPVQVVLTGRTGPLTDTDQAHVATAVDTITAKIGAYREHSEKTGSKLHSMAANTVARTVPESLRDANTVEEASSAIRSGLLALRKQAGSIGPSGVPYIEEFHELESTLSEMNDLVGATEERTGIRTAADDVDSELDKLRSYAEKTGSISHRATADVAVNLSKELRMADSAEEACAAVDRVYQDLIVRGRGIAFLKEHSELQFSLAGIRGGIEDAAGRDVARLSPEERAAEDSRRAEFKANMAESDRSRPRVGAGGYFAAR